MFYVPVCALLSMQTRRVVDSESSVCSWNFELSILQHVSQLSMGCQVDGSKKNMVKSLLFPVILFNRKKTSQVGKNWISFIKYTSCQILVWSLERSFFLSPRNNFGTTIGQGFRGPRCSISRCVPETTLDFSHNDPWYYFFFFWLGPLFLRRPLRHTIQIQVNHQDLLKKKQQAAQRLLQ